MDKLEEYVRQLVKEEIQSVISEDQEEIIKAQKTIQNLDKNFQTEKDPVRKAAKKILLDRAKLELYRKIEDDAQEKQKDIKGEIIADKEKQRNAKIRDRNDLPGVSVTE